MIDIRETSEGIIFKIFVQPRSSKNVIDGLYGDALKIRLTAAPVNNAANQMCLTYLSKRLGVAKSCLEIVKGHTSRSKQLLLRSDQTEVSENQHNHLKKLIENLVFQ
ncbi:MAG: DUF167 domain-containing protein [Deltaproteobacteria bacterium]|nr:DUF167 domain-containing protein [Deltaproteobacteria bacterium]